MERMEMQQKMKYNLNDHKQGRGWTFNCDKIQWEDSMVKYIFHRLQQKEAYHLEKG